jgi:hypothetical protein
VCVFLSNCPVVLRNAGREQQRMKWRTLGDKSPNRVFIGLPLRHSLVKSLTKVPKCPSGALQPAHQVRDGGRARLLASSKQFFKMRSRISENHIECCFDVGCVCSLLCRNLVVNDFPLAQPLVRRLATGEICFPNSQRHFSQIP